MALLELTVTDLALIDRVRVPLSGGFTVITGETGAGKSLLIDALLLVSGGRADSGLIRAGAQLGAGGGAVRPTQRRRRWRGATRRAAHLRA